MSILTKENFEARKDAEEFHKDEYYNKNVCLKPISRGGIKKKTFDDSIKRLKNEISHMTDDDVFFFEKIYNEDKTSLCCLPKNHEGKCMLNYDDYFSDRFHNKLNDCKQAPGGDDIIFKNRIGRSFPVQLSKKNQKSLKSKYNLKKNGVKTKSCIPIENASTPFMIATVFFDFASLLLKIQGIENHIKNIPHGIKQLLENHADYLVKYYYDNGVCILKDEFLCCPVMGVILDPEWFSKDDDEDSDKSPNQIQFGHVIPICDNKYMTRGRNILPITRRGNAIQSDSPLMDVHIFVNQSAEHLTPRKLSE
jgi:hypothetical protein